MISLAPLRRWLPLLSVSVLVLLILSPGPAQAAHLPGVSHSTTTVTGKTGGLHDATSRSVPYLERELLVQNGQTRLAGSLLLPAGDGPFPGVVMLHGSGPDTRSTFLKTGDAQVFLEAGVAVFIYDKRGTGGSSGDWKKATIEDLVDDAVAAVRAVKQQPEINPDQVGVFGVSQGGRLTPLVAVRSEDVAFLINVTGAAVAFGPQEMWSTGNELHQRGFSDRAIATTMKVMHLLFSARPLIRSGVLPLGDLYIWFDALDPDQDPAGAWAAVDRPAYVAYGGQDSVVPTRESLAVIEHAFNGGVNPLSRVVLFPEAGHGIRLESGQWAPGHIESMIGWLQATLKGQAIAEVTPDKNSLDAGPNRWFGLGSAKRPWYASAAFQLPLMLFFLLVFTVGLVMALTRRFNVRLDRLSGFPRATLLGVSLVNLLLMAGLVNVIAYLAFADANNAGWNIPHSGLLSLLSGASVLLAAGMVLSAVWAYRAGIWRKPVLGLFTGLTLSAVAFVAFLGYWNLLGPAL